MCQHMVLYSWLHDSWLMSLTQVGHTAFCRHLMRKVDSWHPSLVTQVLPVLLIFCVGKKTSCTPQCSSSFPIWFVTYSWHRVKEAMPTIFWHIWPAKSAWQQVPFHIRSIESSCLQSRIKMFKLLAKIPELTYMQQPVHQCLQITYFCGLCVADMWVSWYLSEEHDHLDAVL